MKNDFLESAISSVITHSFWLEENLEKIENILNYFKLDETDYQCYKRFISEQGSRLLINAKIMEEKRYRELLQSIKLTYAVCGESLKNVWHSYLKRIQLDQPIPQSPAHEAVCFLAHYLDINHVPTMINSIIKYELAKNSTVIFSFNKKILNKEEQKKYFIVNPSMINLVVDIDMISCIREIKKLKDWSNTVINNEFQTEETRIVLYKNRQSDSVITLRSTQLTDFLIRNKENGFLFDEYCNEIEIITRKNRNYMMDMLESLRNCDMIEYVNEVKNDFLF